MNQEQLFNDIINFKHYVQFLAGFVQNDFERMLVNGDVTKMDIQTTIIDMNEQFNNGKCMLSEYQKKCETLMKLYAE